MLGVGKLGTVTPAGTTPLSVLACPAGALVAYNMADAFRQQGKFADAMVQYAISYQTCPDPWIMAQLRDAAAHVPGAPSTGGVGLGAAVVVGVSLLALGFVLGKVV